MSVSSSPAAGGEAELFAQLAEAADHVNTVSQQLQAAVTGKVSSADEGAMDVLHRRSSRIACHPSSTTRRSTR